MADKSTPRRRYVSPKRARAAERTRGRILDAARSLLEGGGYAGTTLARVAEEAGVALPTVYATFGSKAQLLRALVDRVKDEIGLGAAFRAMLDDPDPASALRRAVRVTRDYSRLGGPVLDALRAAGDSEPDLSAVWREIETMRHRGQRRLVGTFAAAGALRPDLDPARATDLLWTLTAHDLYRLLVTERGWSAKRYEAWLAGHLVETLLAPARRARPAS